jgi:hypothetical protein
MDESLAGMAQTGGQQQGQMPTVEQIAQALMQGATPEQLLQAGVPRELIEQAIALLQQAMAEQQAGGQPPQQGGAPAQPSQPQPPRPAGNPASGESLANMRQ